ncbi:MAG: DUF481 domain-containing protein [Candidatus Marinimicrobia bacterium]|nr:DUF481 domain-containing protein [Candidatus Neomarinimicrobiota bacterium]
MIHYILILLSVGCLIAQVNTEDLRAEDANGIMHQFSLDLAVEKADEEVVDIAAEYRLDVAIKKGLTSFLILNYENGYEKEKGADINTIVNKGFGHLRVTKSLTEKYFLEGFSQFGFNDFLDLNNRFLVGSGLRVKLSNSNRTTIFLGIGAMQENETYGLATEPEMKLIRSTNYLTYMWKLSDTIQLNNTAYFQVASSDAKDYRVLYDGGFDIALNKSFSIAIKLNYRYDNDPHGTLGNTYIQLSNGISFIF